MHDVHIKGTGSAKRTAYTKHHALATGKQNADKAIPGGKPCKSGSCVKNTK